MKTQLIDDYKIRFLDEVLVIGKSLPMKIYEVFDFEPNNIKEYKENNQKLMEEAFSYYQKGEFLKAIDLYEKLEISNEELGMDENKSKIPHSSFLIQMLIQFCISFPNATGICRFARKTACSRAGMLCLSLWINRN